MDNPAPSDRLDEIFELSVLQEDFNYSYNGLILSCIKPAKKVASSQLENDKMEDYLNSFWSECPIAGCDDSSCGHDRYVYITNVQNTFSRNFLVINLAIQNVHDYSSIIFLDIIHRQNTNFILYRSRTKINWLLLGVTPVIGFSSNIENVKNIWLEENALTILQLLSN